jgi:hypothetical protein
VTAFEAKTVEPSQAAKFSGYALCFRSGFSPAKLRAGLLPLIELSATPAEQAFHTRKSSCETFRLWWRTQLSPMAEGCIRFSMSILTITQSRQRCQASVRSKFLTSLLGQLNCNDKRFSIGRRSKLDCDRTRGNPPAATIQHNFRYGCFNATGK